MNHAQWKTHRHRKLLGEATEDNREYGRPYEEAELAHDLGQMVYDRRTAPAARVIAPRRSSPPRGRRSVPSFWASRQASSTT